MIHHFQVRFSAKLIVCGVNYNHIGKIIVNLKYIGS